MAVPKGKISKARKHSRRANWKLAHRVCKHCGYYKGVQVVNMDEEKNA